MIAYIFHSWPIKKLNVKAKKNLDYQDIRRFMLSDILRNI